MPDQQQFPIPKIERTYGVEPPKVVELPKFVEPVFEPPAPPVRYEYVSPIKVKTVRIYTPDSLSSCIIDADSFNPHQHKLHPDPI